MTRNRDFLKDFLQGLTYKISWIYFKEFFQAPRDQKSGILKRYKTQEFLENFFPRTNKLQILDFLQIFSKDHRPINRGFFKELFYKNQHTIILDIYRKFFRDLSRPQIEDFHFFKSQRTISYKFLKHFFQGPKNTNRGLFKKLLQRTRQIWFFKETFFKRPEIVDF